MWSSFKLRIHVYLDFLSSDSVMYQLGTADPKEVEDSGEERQVDKGGLRSQSAMDNLLHEATGILPGDNAQSDSSTPANQAQGSEAESVPPLTLPPSSPEPLEHGQKRIHHEMLKRRHNA